MAVLKELLDIEMHLKRGADLMNGMRVAVGEAMDGPGRSGSGGGEVVFSVELDVEKPES